MKRYLPTPSNPWNYAKAQHLLRRATLAPRDEEVRRAVVEGVDKTLERLFTPFIPPLDLIADWAGQEPLTTPYAPDGDEYWRWFWEVIGRRTGLNQWWMKTMIDSPVSLQEQMTLFWHGHFVTSFSMVQCAEFMYGQQQLFRRFVWGNFKQFVKEITIDPAMLIYLNGRENAKYPWQESINENYARELMELFTVGRVNNSGEETYSQADVRAAARAFTGWKLVASRSKGEKYTETVAVFEELRHDSSMKTFLGETGAWTAFDAIDVLFRQRGNEIAEFMCRKLYRTFISLDTNSPSAKGFIGDLAGIFRTGNWEIKPVLEALFSSEHFFEAETVGALPKSGATFLLGLLRMLNAGDVPDFQPTPAGELVNYRWSTNDLLLRMEAMGQFLFFPPNVAGWAGGREWVSPSALAVRMKYANNIALGTTKMRDWQYITPPIFTFDPVQFARQFPKPNSARALVQDMAIFFLCEPPSDDETAMLLVALLDGAREYEWSLDKTVLRPGNRICSCLAAMFMLPKFQLH